MDEISAAGLTDHAIGFLNRHFRRRNGLALPNKQERACCQYFLVE